MDAEIKKLVTYSTYLFFQISDDSEFQVTKAHYTSKGMMAHILDKTDGQKYIMEIYPDK